MVIAYFGFIYRSPLARRNEDKENGKEVMQQTESPEPLSQKGGDNICWWTVARELFINFNLKEKENE